MSPEEKELVQGRTDKLLAKIEDLYRQIAELNAANGELAEKTRELALENLGLRDQIERLMEEGKTAREMIGKLEGTVCRLAAGIEEIEGVLLADDAGDKEVIAALKICRRLKNG